MSSKKQKILDLLKEEILSLQLKPGTLISESMLTSRFQLSRTPIRDIVKQLALEGYIDIFPQRGNLVSYIDLESVEQIIYLRSTLEKEILLELSGNLLLKAVHELKGLLAEQLRCIDSSGSFNEFLALDDAFHEKLYELAGRQFLWDLIKQFNVHYVRYRKLHMLNIDKLKYIQKEHEELLQYLIDNDRAPLEALVLKHIRSDVHSNFFADHYTEYIKV